MEMKRYFYGWWMLIRAVWIMRTQDRNDIPSWRICFNTGSACRWIVDGQCRFFETLARHRTSRAHEAQEWR